MLFREDYYNPTEENKGIAEVLIAKQRNGPTGTVKLAFIKEYTRFETRPRTSTTRARRRSRDFQLPKLTRGYGEGCGPFFAFLGRDFV